MDLFIKSKLSPDEKILWEGRPELGIFIMGRKLDSLFFVCFIIYSAVVIMLRIFDELVPITNLVVVPFLLGLFLWLCINFIKIRTRYIISDKRAMSFIDLFLWRIESQSLIDRIRRLGKYVYPGAKIGFIDIEEVSFIDIKDVEGVYNILNNLVNKK